MKQARRIIPRVKPKFLRSAPHPRVNLTARAWHALTSFGLAAPRRPLALATIAVVAFSSPAVQAQTTDVFSLPTSGRETTVTLNANETYDSNVARGSSELAQLRGIKQDDEIFSPSASASISRSFGVSTFYV
jgi:hypothetical protein